jgi:uncharacterized delta-60 repeat protein
MKGNILFCKFLFVSLFLVIPFFVYATPGELDQTFGNGGKVVTPISEPFSGGVSAVVVQSDGKIVSTGNTLNFFLVRHNSDGSIDNSFGVNGKVRHFFSFDGDSISKSLVIQSDGKIVIAGTAFDSNKFNLAIARFHSNGNIDTTFGVQGKFTTDLSPNTNIGSSLLSIAMQSDGKIVAAGRKDCSSVFVIRTNTNGTLDNSFADNGVYTSSQINLGTGYSTSQLVIQADGKILVAGNSNFGGTITSTLIRLNTSGTLDKSFANNGTLRIDNDIQRFTIDSISLQSNEKIIVAGTIFRNSSHPFPFVIRSYYNGEVTLLRYNQDGSIDTSFGNDGYSILYTRRYSESLSSVVVQADDKILVCGTIYSLIKGRYLPAAEWDWDFLIVRFNKHGSLDNSFGGSGSISTDFGNHLFDSARDMVIQPDGKIIVAGNNSTNGSPSDFVFARYLNQ